MTDQPPASPADLPSPERLQELLFDAARMGRDDVVTALVRFGADPEARDAKGYTPLILASYNDNRSTTALLLDLGARIDAPDGGRGNTPLMGVAFKGYVPIAELLLARGANPLAHNREGQTALMLATLFGHAPIVEALLARGADPDEADAAGNSARSLAQRQDNDAMLALLDGARS